MPDVPDVPDIRDPVPDLGHESLRRSTVAALDRIEEQVARIERVFLLLKGTGHAMQGTLNVLLGAQSTQGQVHQALTDLTARVTALEAQIAALIPPTP